MGAEEAETSDGQPVVILSLAPELLALGIWPTLLAALLVVGLNLAILRDLRIL